MTVGGQVPVLILESASPAPDASLYLARALDVARRAGIRDARRPRRPRDAGGDRRAPP